MTEFYIPWDTRHFYVASSALPLTFTLRCQVRPAWLSPYGLHFGVSGQCSFSFPLRSRHCESFFENYPYVVVLNISGRYVRPSFTGKSSNNPFQEGSDLAATTIGTSDTHISVLLAFGKLSSFHLFTCLEGGGRFLEVALVYHRITDNNSNIL
jgi:hypothetical protein